jgi:hypothetical protein
MFDKLKSLVFEDEKKVEVAPVVAAPAAFVMTSSATGGVNAEMMGILQGAMSNNKTSHTTFIETAAKIAGVIADEATRYKTAAASIGADKATLLSAVDSYGPILASEKAAFQQNLDATLGNEINLLISTNTTISGQIADLNKQLSALAEENLRNLQDISERQNQYSGFVKDFDATLAKVTSDLETERKKLDIYLGG